MMFPIRNIDILITNVDDSTETVTLEAPNGDDPFVTHLERVITRRKFRDKNMFQRRGREDYKIRFVYNYASHDMDLRKFLGAKAIELKAPPSLSGDYTTYDVRFVNEEAVKNWFRNLPIASMPDDPTEADTIPSGEVTLEFETVVPLSYSDMNIKAISFCIEPNGNLRFDWEDWPGADSYNIYLSDGGDYYKLNDDPITTSRYSKNPVEIGDGDFTARIHPITSGEEESFRYQATFTLDQALNLTLNLTGSSGAVADIGDSLLLFYAYEGGNVEEIQIFDELQFHFEDFSEKMTGEFPSDFGWSWNNSKQSGMEIEDSEEFAGSKAIRFFENGNERRAVLWGKPGLVKNCDFKGKFKSSVTTSNQIRLGMRISGYDGTENLISLELFDGTEFRTFSYNATGSDSVTYNWSPDTWYMIRGNIYNNYLKGKVWKHGDPEPGEWMIEVQLTDVFDEVGYIGFSNFTDPDPSLWIDYLEVLPTTGVDSPLNAGVS